MATALYRRYRPESFADVIGQEHVTEPLMQALRTGRVNHAYLFSGPRGCGKTTSARILARCLNCEQGPTPTPCGVCDSCVALARGGSGSVDVIEIDAASHGGVDDARDLRERASYGPAQSRFKIYIIDEAHMVTPQGFNALLKIVEEPPEHVKFVFATTEPEKVIGTIRSRTHHYPFRLVPPARLADYMQHLCDLEGITVAPGVLSFVTRAGGGSVRDSLSVLDQLIAGSGDDGLTYEQAVSLLGFTDAELLDAVIDAFAAGDGAAVFRQIDKVIESGHDPRRFIEDLLERLRDLIIVAAVPDGVAQVLRGVPEDQLDRMRVQQSQFGPGALSRAADIANAGLTEMTGANSPRLQLELICARILLPAASGEQGYAARLDRLERRLEMGGVPSSARGTPTAPPASAAQPASAAPPAAPASPPAPASSAPRASEAPARPAPAPQTAAVTSEPSTQPGPGAGSIGEPARLTADAGRPPRHPEQSAPPRQEAAAAASPPASEQEATQEVATPEPAVQRPGGMDTDAIRRAWPDVLGRIFGMRRATWTFVSQNTQVVSYDGKTLTLGIETIGLANTFRQGNHAELVRQALIDQLGIDVMVDGVPMPDSGSAAAPSAPVAPPAGSVPRASDDPPPAAAPGPEASDDLGASAGSPPGADGRSSGSGPEGTGSAGGPLDPALSALAGASTGGGAATALQHNGGWGSSSAPAPEWAAPTTPAPQRAAAPTPSAPDKPAAASEPTPVTDPTPTTASGAGQPTHPTKGALRGASAVRQSFAQARSGSAQRGSDGPPRIMTDDSAVSDDDEDIEQSGDVGRAVIEKVLGGRVVSEIDD